MWLGCTLYLSSSGRSVVYTATQRYIHRADIPHLLPFSFRPHAHNISGADIIGYVFFLPLKSSYPPVYVDMACVETENSHAGPHLPPDLDIAHEETGTVMIGSLFVCTEFEEKGMRNPLSQSAKEKGTGRERGGRGSGR